MGLFRTDVALVGHSVILYHMLGVLFNNPLSFLFWLVALAMAITIHEFAHAYTADRLGDPTPRLQGRLTLNPLAHLDPLGTLMLLLVRFGWGKPVQFDPFNLKNPRKDGALISLAGPASNLLILPSGKETEIGWESFAPLSKEKAKKLVNLLLDIDECPHRVQSPYRGSFGDQTLFDCSHPDRKAVNAQYGSCDVLDTVCPPVQNDGAEAILPEHKS